MNMLFNAAVVEADGVFYYLATKFFMENLPSALAMKPDREPVVPWHNPALRRNLNRASILNSVDSPLERGPKPSDAAVKTN